MSEATTTLPPMGTKGASPMITAADVARTLLITEAGVYTMARRGTLPIPVLKFGRTVRFRRSDLEAFIGCPLEMES